MANVFDRYGIKEVADVTFYSLDENEQRGAPVLYLDTLKVSTIEQTAESTDARGGKGNAALITWDYGKEITVSLEDALYSAKSLALQYGDIDSVGAADTTIMKTLWKENVEVDGENVSAVINGVKVTLGTPAYYKADGKEGSATDFAYVTGSVAATGAYTIDVSANSFPGTLAA